MVNISPAPEGYILIILPTVFILSREQVLHPKIVWNSYGMIMTDDWEIPPDVRQIIVCMDVLAEWHYGRVLAKARAHEIRSVFRVSTSEHIGEWVDSVPFSSDDSTAAENYKKYVALAAINRKERMIEMAQANANTDGRPAKTILVVGADTTKFDEDMRRDPRLMHWGAGNVEDKTPIPDSVQTVIWCRPEIGHAKSVILQRIIENARGVGRSFKTFEAHHQQRLREVLSERLGNIENEKNARNNSAEIISEDPITVPGIIRSDSVEANAPVVVPVTGPESSPLPIPSALPLPASVMIADGSVRRLVIVPEDKALPVQQIVARHYEEAKGESKLLIKFAQQYRAGISKASVYTAKNAYLAKMRKGGGVRVEVFPGCYENDRASEPAPPRVETSPPADYSFLPEPGKQAEPPAGDSIEASLYRAINHVERGLLALKTLRPHIADMAAENADLKARLKRLAPFEQAVAEFQSQKPEK